MCHVDPKRNDRRVHALHSLRVMLVDLQLRMRRLQRRIQQAWREVRRDRKQSAFDAVDDSLRGFCTPCVTTGAIGQ